MKKIKGFTLIELIIVMGIFGILMAAIMRMFTPIRETYVDSTLYESQRTTQNGIITYITESVRYSTDMGVYNGVVSAQAAVDSFADAYCNNYGITDPAVKDMIKERVDFIAIDNTATEYGGKDCYGRVIRRKIDGTTTVSDDYGSNPDKARLAFGAAYYDDNTYSIGIDVSTVPTTGIFAVTVASTANHGGRVLTRSANDAVDSTSDLSTLKLISTSGDVICRNLTNSELGVSTAGMCDTTSYSGSSTIKGSKTYIVFVDYSLKKELDAIS